MPEINRPLKVFLSYASQDRPLVRELSRRFIEEGWIETWQDEKNLLPGQDWRIKIEEAVENADVVIICLSNHSVSKEGHVQKELRYAREIALEKPEDAIFLIPLRLDECEVPRGLRFYQWVDYFDDKKDPSYLALVASLKLRYEQKLKVEEEENLRKEQREREAAEKAEKEAAEQARLKAEEEGQRKIAKRKAEFEAVERVARKKTEKEAVEKARLKEEEEVSLRLAKEKLESESAENATREKTKRERREKELVEKQAGEIYEKIRREDDKKNTKHTYLRSKTTRQGIYWLGSFAFLGISSITILILGIILLSSLSNFPLIPNATPTKPLIPNATQVKPHLLNTSTPVITLTLSSAASITPTEVFSTSCIVKYDNIERRCTCNSVKCACYADWDMSDGFQQISTNYYTAARSLIELQISQSNGKCQ